MYLRFTKGICMPKLSLKKKKKRLNPMYWGCGWWMLWALLPFNSSLLDVPEGHIDTPTIELQCLHPVLKVPNFLQVKCKQISNQVELMHMKHNLGYFFIRSCSNGIRYSSFKVLTSNWRDIHHFFIKKILVSRTFHVYINRLQPLD